MRPSAWLQRSVTESNALNRGVCSWLSPQPQQYTLAPSRFRSSLPCVAWKAAGIIHINRPYESCRNSVFFLHFWASALILDISCALTIWHWGYSRLHPPSDEIRGAWPSAFIRVTATSSLALQSCKTKTRAYVGLEEQILLNNLTERRISSVSFFLPSPLRLTQDGSDATEAGSAQKILSRMLNENLLNVHSKFLLLVLFARRLLLPTLVNHNET